MKRRIVQGQALALQGQSLETRLACAVWGNPWPEPENLTVSFQPDGTDVEGRPSQLTALLGQNLPTSGWQTEILRAFQTWAQYSNINLSVIDDQGGAGGTLAGLQGSAKQGDFRIGAVPLSHGELAVAAPFDVFSDWSGDVLLNSDFTFGVGGTAPYDLYTVLLQEAGHALSLPNSPNATSAMFTTYQGRRTGLASEDISAVRGLYGARTPDRFEGTTGNQTAARATPLEFIYDAAQLDGTPGTAGPRPFVAAADLTTYADRDYYRVVLPSDLHDFTVELRTTGVSLLKARIKVFDSAQRVVGSAVATDPLSGNLAVFVSSAQPGGTYYVQVEGAQDDAWGVGAYRLAIGKEAHEALFPSQSTFLNDDRGDDDGDDAGAIIALPARTSTVNPRWDATYRASVSFPGDTDTYRVDPPANADATRTRMIVTVWSLDGNPLDPIVEARAGSPTAALASAKILRNDAGVYTIEITGISPSVPWYVRVGAADPAGGLKEGNYLVGVNFLNSALPFQTFANTTLKAANPQQLFTLDNQRTALYHWRLDADSVQPQPNTAVRVTLYDSQRQVVMSRVVLGGEIQTWSILLNPGVYTLRLVAAVKDNATALLPFKVRLDGLAFTDPIGPTLIDPTGNPAGSTRPRAGIDYFWQYYAAVVSWLSPTDPYGNPW